MAQKQSFITEADEKAIINAIKSAEKNTSGEIRVHLEPHCKTSTEERAKTVFQMLNMHHTEQHNGVLFYLAVNDHQFYILGDSGIHKKVDDNFWESTKEVVIKQFKNGQFAQGLIDGILMAGNQLKTFFPYQSDDTNELSDEISKG